MNNLDTFPECMLPDGADACSGYTELYLAHVELAEKLNFLKECYIELTNCDQYSEGFDVQGHHCPNDLLQRFDSIFKEQEDN